MSLNDGLDERGERDMSERLSLDFAKDCVKIEATGKGESMTHRGGTFQPDAEAHQGPCLSTGLACAASVCRRLSP